MLCVFLCVYTSVCIWVTITNNCFYAIFLFQDFEDDNEYGHDFGLTMVKKPRPCSICEDIIWSDAIVCSSEQ